MRHIKGISKEKELPKEPKSTPRMFHLSGPSATRRPGDDAVTHADHRAYMNEVYGTIARELVDRLDREVTSTIYGETKNEDSKGK